ncbi:MAG: hypothetical protein M0Q12_06065 [Synergistaceae bacterium]|jgi:hypothetical protein|nr:hypothetical protein [Synergistaceae bacterium]
MLVNQSADIIRELEIVSVTLEKAKKYNLESEVVLFAIKSALCKDNSSVEGCIKAGLDEWIK